jgi:hypothetical protein
MAKNLKFAIYGFIVLSSGAASAQDRTWQSAAKWHRTLKKAVPGTLVLDQDGVEFRSPKLNRR